MGRVRETEERVLILRPPSFALFDLDYVAVFEELKLL